MLEKSRKKLISIETGVHLQISTEMGVYKVIFDPLICSKPAYGSLEQLELPRGLSILLCGPLWLQTPNRSGQGPKLQSKTGPLTTFELQKHYANHYTRGELIQFHG